MAYGTVKVDNITFDNGGVDQNIQVKDLFESTTSGLTVTGTISGQRIEAVSGVITTVSGTNLTYTTAGVQNISGGTLNYSSGIFASGTQTNPSIAFSGDVDTGFYNPTPNQIGITTAGGERVRIQDDGDVGIGTTNPVAKLHVAENSSAPGVLITQAGAGTALTVSGASVFSSTVTATTFSGNVVGNLTGTASAIADNTVTSAKIVDGTIVNADINASAAIAGTKISPNFGSQNVVTTGTSTAASLIPTGSSVPTNGVYLPAANSVAISTNGTGRLFVDSSGRVLVTTSIAYSVPNYAGSAITPQVQTSATTIAGGAYANIAWYTGAANGPNYVFARSNSATPGTYTAVSASSSLGNISFAGSDGTGFVTGANIAAQCDGIPNTGSMPGRLVFSTTPSGSGTPTERMRLDSSGRLGLGTSSPSVPLHVTGNSKITGSLVVGTSDDWTFSSAWRGIKLSDRHAIQATPGASSVSLSSNAAIGASGWEYTVSSLTAGQYANSGGIHTFSSADAGVDGDPVTWNEKVRITSGGNVGIGTTSPQQLLHLEAGEAFKLRLQRTGASPSICEIGNTGNLLALSQNVNGISFETGTTPTERARIDSSGRLLVGTSTSSTYTNHQGTQATYSSFLQLASQGDTGASITLNSNRSNNVGISQLAFQRTNGTIAAPTPVVNNGVLGANVFNGYDGTNYVTGATIAAAVDGTPGANDMPGRLVFSVTADGSASPTEALRISNNRAITVSDGGNVVLGTTTGTKIGTATSQKIGFYNATPVVQPTTGVAEAAFVENSGGTAVNVDSTFGGYTIQQVVQALQTLGLLA
jgi:hypothetical protein